MKHSNTKRIEEFDITYETEGGRTFAYGYCPHCGWREESMQLGSVDAGLITVGKLRTHIKMSHHKQD